MTPPPSLAAFQALLAAETAVEQLLTRLYDTPDSADRAAVMDATLQQVRRQLAIASDTGRQQQSLAAELLTGIARVLTALRGVEEARATGTQRVEVCWLVEVGASLPLDRLVQVREVAERYRLMTQDLYQALVPVVGAGAASITLTVADTLLDPVVAATIGADRIVRGQLDAAAQAYREQVDHLHGLDDPQERAQALHGMRALLLVQARLLRRRAEEGGEPSVHSCTAAEVDDMATVVGAVMFTEASRAVRAPRIPAECTIIEAAAGQVLDRLVTAVDPDERYRLTAVHLYNAVAPHTGANAALVITEIAATIHGVTPPLRPGQPIGGPGRTHRAATGTGTADRDADDGAGDVLQGTVGPAPGARPELWEQIPGTPPLTGPAGARAARSWDIPAPASDAGTPGWRRTDADEAVRITIDDLDEKPTTQQTTTGAGQAPAESAAVSAEEQRRAMVAGFSLMLAFCVLVITWLPRLGLFRTFLTVTALLVICGGIATVAGLLTKWTQEDS